MNSILQLASILCAGVIIFFIYKDLDAKNTFDKEISMRYKTTSNQLIKIKLLEKEYRKKYGVFTKQPDSLVSFAKKERFIFTSKKYILEKIKVNGIDTLIKKMKIDTIKNISIKDSLFKKNQDINKLVYLPFGKTNKKISFIIKQIITKKKDAFSIFSASILKKDLLFGLDQKLVNIELNNKDLIK